MAKLDLGLPSYMGRGILVGLTTQGDPASIYFAEGRSPPSRKRKLQPYPHWSRDWGRVHMDVNSETTLEELKRAGGNPKLLLYNAMRGNRDGLLVVSNGFHTDSDAVWEGEGREEENLVDTIPGGIYHRIVRDGVVPRNAVYQSLEQAGSEVDTPTRTARIAAASWFDRDPSQACMGIVIRPRTRDGTLTTVDRIGVNSVTFRPAGVFFLFATYGVDNPPYHAALPPYSVSSLTDNPIHLDGTTPAQL